MTIFTCLSSQASRKKIKSCLPIVVIFFTALNIAFAPAGSAKSKSNKLKKKYTKKWEVEVLVGPPSLASGGSNPISLPPANIAEYEVTLTTKSRWHFRLGLTPHIAAAGRLFKLKYGFQTAVGASIVNSLHGYGPGIFSVFAWQSPCALKRLCFTAQYIQDVGLSVTQWQITAPFGVRLGLVWKI
jgi:hypothetical protein